MHSIWTLSLFWCLLRLVLARSFVVNILYTNAILTFVYLCYISIRILIFWVNYGSYLHNEMEFGGLFYVLLWHYVPVDDLEHMFSGAKSSVWPSWDNVWTIWHSFLGVLFCNFDRKSNHQNSYSGLQISLYTSLTHTKCSMIYIYIYICLIWSADIVYHFCLQQSTPPLDRKRIDLGA